MIETAELIRYLQNSQMPERLKAIFIPIAQTASPETREQIYHKIEEYNAKAIRIRKHIEPLSVDDIIFLRGEIEDYQEKKRQEKQQQPSSLLVAHG